MIPNKDVFCPSPWIHIRLSFAGNFIPCRWAYKKGWFTDDPTESNIKNTSLLEYFNSQQMSSIRFNMLSGVESDICFHCFYEDTFNKLSGRKKQLFRFGLDNPDTFNSKYLSTSYYEIFENSWYYDGTTQVQPFDLQIDLDNTCNAACIMCLPGCSTRVTADYIKLHQINQNLFELPKEVKCWATDAVLLQKFISELKELPFIQYLHLLGGETLFVESFYQICNALIDADLAKDIVIGTTTNCTISPHRVTQVIPQFKNFHLGLSIESVNPLNDYIRYPSKINKVLSIIDEFIDLRKKNENLTLLLRITPNVFSIYYIDEVIQYMIDKNITAESCFILANPSCLRIELLPDDIRIKAIKKLVTVAEKNGLVRAEQTPNTRQPELIRQVQSNVVHGYIDFLTNMQEPNNVEEERYKLVQFLKGFESLRGNSILDYAPEFSDFLKKYGYER